MSKLKDLHRRWSEDAEYQSAYEVLGKEFGIAKTLIEQRTRADASESQALHAKDKNE